MENALAFNEVKFDVIDHYGQLWIRVSQIATALQYASTQRVIELYTRHADEFTDTMTALIKLPTEGGEQEVRIFSLRGCHLLAMLARTPVAKAFRKWVLDVLDRIAKEESEKQNAATAELPPSDQNIIQTLVKAIADRYPEAEQRSIYMQVWMRFRNHFRIGSYKQLQPEQMADAVAYLVNLKINEKKKAIEQRNESNCPARMGEDKYEAYLYDVEAFRAETATKIEALLHRGLNFVDAKKLGAGGIIAFTPVLLDWLQRVAGQPSPILRRNEPVSRAIDYSPLYLLRHMEKVPLSS